MDSGHSDRHSRKNVIRSSDGSPVHPSHGSFHLVRLLIGSVLMGWALVLGFMILGFLGTLEFAANMEIPARWVFGIGSVLGISAGIIFALISSLILNIFPLLKEKIHPLTPVRAAFVFFLVWQVLAFIGWPAIEWLSYAAPVIALIAAVFSIKSNPHSELIPHSSLGRILGTAIGPLLAMVMILAIVVPMQNRAFGWPNPPRLIFVAVDGVDETYLTELLASPDAGRYPEIQALQQQGVYGSLNANVPLIPERLWADLITGTGYEEHGILDRNSTSDDLQVMPIWEILAMKDIRTGLFQMPPPHEAVSRSKYDVPAPGTGEASDDTIALTLFEFRNAGGQTGWPSVFQAPVLCTKMARLGVRLETFNALFDELMLETFTTPSWRLTYARRKNLQFQVETDIALALVRKYRTAAVFLRFPSLSPIFTQYRRYAKPNEFGPPPLDVDCADAAGLARVIPDSYALLDEFLGRLDPFRNQRTLLVLAANHGERSAGRDRGQDQWIDADNLLNVTGWTDRTVWDISATGTVFRAPGLNEVPDSHSDFADLLRNATWTLDPENPTDRRLFSVSSYADRIEVSVVNASDLTPESLVTIGDWSGTFSEISVSNPPSGIISANGLFIISGRPFKPNTRATTVYVYDVVPTVLHASGIEIAEYLQGRPVEEIFDPVWYGNHPPQTVEDYLPPEPEPQEEPVQPSVPTPESVVDPEFVGPFVQLDPPQPEISDLSEAPVEDL